MRVLALGDVCGSIGRQAIKSRIPYLKEELQIDFVIANGENSAGGVGITSSTINELLNAKIDCITGGNHSWKNSEVYNKFNTEEIEIHFSGANNCYLLSKLKNINILNIFDYENINTKIDIPCYINSFFGVTFKNIKSGLRRRLLGNFCPNAKLPFETDWFETISKEFPLNQLDNRIFFFYMTLSFTAFLRISELLNLKKKDLQMCDCLYQVDL